MPFVFRFQTVLDYRRRLCDEAQAALQGAERAHLTASAALRSAQQASASAEAAALAAMMPVSPSTVLDIATLNHWRSYRDLLAHTVRQASADAVEAERRVEERRAALRAALRDVEVLQHLEQRDHAQYDAEQRQREAAALDEAATTRFARQP